MPSRAGTQVCLAPALGVKEGVSEKAREANRADQEELTSLLESGFYPEGSRQPWEGSPHGYFLWGTAWRQGHAGTQPGSPCTTPGTSDRLYWVERGVRAGETEKGEPIKPHDGPVLRTRVK